ncbi:hypothetical protein J4437_03780 [Candidatus Woesearchaeota archaeon]|nr:hypothetical protein [Candidatus Woesearchaeota archaeon]
MNSKHLKIIGYVVLAILVLNMILFGMGLVNGLVFWLVIALGAIFVYFGLPKMKENK